MLKFPTQLGVEIYVSQSGLICFKQQSPTHSTDVIVSLTIGQLRALIKKSDSLISEAEIAKLAYQEGLENETNS